MIDQFRGQAGCTYISVDEKRKSAGVAVFRIGVERLAGLNYPEKQII